MPPKIAKKRGRTPESDESGRDDGGKSSAKKSKTKASKPEEQFWALSKNRRITVNEYNKKTMINIREYYDADGEMKPSKKGISLSIEHYKELLKAIPAINEELAKQGHDLDASDVEEKPTSAKKAKENTKKEKKAPKKANIEATSDEESD